jgi:hypothetical protein
MLIYIFKPNVGLYTNLQKVRTRGNEPSPTFKKMNSVRGITQIYERRRVPLLQKCKLYNRLTAHPNVSALTVFIAFHPIRTLYKNVSLRPLAI